MTKRRLNVREKNEATMKERSGKDVEEETFRDKGEGKERLPRRVVVAIVAVKEGTGHKTAKDRLSDSPIAAYKAADELSYVSMGCG